MGERENGAVLGRSAPIAGFNVCATPENLTAATHWTLTTSAPAHLLPAAQDGTRASKGPLSVPRAA